MRLSKYIRDNVLYVGLTDNVIQKNLDVILDYVYHQYSLDHDKMEELYKNIQVPISFGDKKRM